MTSSAILFYLFSCLFFSDCALRYQLAIWLLPDVALVGDTLFFRLSGACGRNGKDSGRQGRIAEVVGISGNRKGVLFRLMFASNLTIFQCLKVCNRGWAVRVVLAVAGLIEWSAMASSMTMYGQRSFHCWTGSAQGVRLHV